MAGRTYEGRTGRMVGILWGGFWVTLGAVFTSIWVVRSNLFPRGLRDALLGAVPLLASGGLSSRGTLFFGLFGGIGLCLGLYELGTAMFRADYSITVSSRRGGGGV